MHKPKLIHFNETQFNKDLETFEAKKSLESSILITLSNLGFFLSEHEETKFFEDTKAGVNILIESKYEAQNTLNLSGSKLISLLDLKFPLLESLISKYESFKIAVEPNKEDYCIYTSNQNEAIKLDLSNCFIKAVNDMKGITTVYPGIAMQSVSNVIEYNHSTQSFLPSVNFIKDNR